MILLGQTQPERKKGNAGLPMLPEKPNTNTFYFPTQVSACPCLPVWKRIDLILNADKSPKKNRLFSSSLFCDLFTT